MAGGIFEAFYLLFESNADELKEGAEKAEKTTDQLEKKLKSTDRAAAGAGASFADMAAKAAQALLPFVGLSAVTSAVENFTATALAAGDLASAVKMDVEQLFAWQGAVERSGGSAEAFNGSIKSLSDSLFAMRRGGGGEAATALWQLGVKARDARGQMKDAGAVLLDLSDKFSRMNRQSAQNFGKRLGLDEKTILTLQQGRKGVEELLARQKELALITQKDVEASKKYREAKSDVGRALGGLAGILARAVLPALTGAMQGAVGFFTAISKHKGLVEGFFLGLALLLGVIAVKSAIAFAPVLLMVAAVLAIGAAFAVAYEDVQAFLNGNQSLIGELSEKYPWLADLVLEIAAAFGILRDIAKAVGVFLVEAIASPGEALDNLKAKIGPLMDDFQAKFPRLGQAIRDVGTIISGLATLAGKVFGALFNFISQFSDEIMAVIDAVLGGIGKAINWVAGLFESDDNAATPVLQSDDKAASRPAVSRAAGLFESDDDTATPVLASEDKTAPRPFASAREGSGPLIRPESLPVPEEAPPQSRPVPEKSAGPAPLPWSAPAPARDEQGRDFYPAGPPPRLMPGDPVYEAMGRGRADMAAVSAAPLSASPKGFGALAAPKAVEVSKEINVEVSGPTTINTQAMDAAGIAGAFSGALQGELRGALEHVDDGVAA